MDNYFTYFRLLTTDLGVNNSRATGVLNKNRLRNCTVLGDKHPQKKYPDHFEYCISSKKAVNFDQNDSRAVYIASSKSCKPKRFVRCWNKIERKYI